MLTFYTPKFIKNMQTISILGCGWLGLELAKLLLRQQYLVKGSTTSPEKIEHLSSIGIQAFLLEVQAEKIVGSAVADFFDSDVLIINIPPGRKNPKVKTEHPQQIKTIVAHASANKIIFVSSTGVYPDRGQVTEDTPTEPSRDSTTALIAAEQYLQQTDKQATILRMAGLVGGERQAGRFFAGKKAVSDPDRPVNMLYRTDGIRVIQAILEQDRWNTIYNVCADQHPTKKAFYQSQARKLGLEAPEFDTDSVAKDYKVVVNEKLKRELNYRFIHPDPMNF